MAKIPLCSLDNDPEEGQETFKVRAWYSKVSFFVVNHSSPQGSVVGPSFFKMVTFSEVTALP